MKLKQLLFLLLCCPLFINAQTFYKTGFFVIKGQVKNLKKPVFDFGMTSYLSHEAIQSVKVQSNGNFEQQFPLQHRQDIFLMLNNDVIKFTVQDKDTLTLQWDDADSKNSFSVKANNELRAKGLQVQSRLSAGFNKSFLDLISSLYEEGKNLVAENKFNLVNEAYNRDVRAIFDSSGFFSENINRLVTGLYFQYTNLLWKERLIPKFKLNLTLDSSRTYPHFDMANIFADYKQLNEDWFWNVSEYRDFIFGYIKFYKPFNNYTSSSAAPTKTFNPTLDEYYLAQSNIYFTNIKDWFITTSIMDGFSGYSFADVENVYKQFINTCQTPYLKDTLQKYYTAVKRLKPGSEAPGFTLKNDKGQSVALNDFKGKVVYIDFWGVGCGPCINDIKNYVPKLHEQYKNKDVVFVNICVDAKEEEWKEGLGKYKLDGVNLIAEGWADHPVCKAYNVSGIPHYILIDKSGKMVNNNAPAAYGLNLASGKNEIDNLLK